MKPYKPLMAILFASATFPLLAQQPTSPDQPGSPTGRPSTQQSPPVAEPPMQNSPAPTPDTSTAPMSAVNGELVSKLDSKTAKVGDDVVVQTKASAKTENGTEVPTGSKLVGHVLAVQPSGEGTNSQVVLQFDHLELKGGQNLPVHSQIQSIAPSEGMASTGGQTAGAPEATRPAQTNNADRSPVQNPNSPSPNGANSGNGDTAQSGTAPSGSGAPAPGTVVAKNGNIAIQTTSIPGVLLANNAPGQSDPRMARASSILLGLKRDIQLDSGTQVVVGVSPAATGKQ